MISRILLIDDDLINSHIITEKLKKKNHEVLTLNDPSQFEEKFNEFNPNIVILDIVMPEISGLDILKQIRLQYKENELPVIMMTANDKPEDVIQALDMGANDYLTKPVNVDIANSRIRTQLNQVSLNKDSVRKKELEAINAMVTTYNHEINNPLAIALGNIHLLKKEMKDTESICLKRIEDSLIRVKDIVKKIEGVTSGEKLSYDTYLDKSKMIKIK